MVKVKFSGGIVGYDANHSVVVNLFADTKEEVTDGMQVQGLPEGYSIAAESTVFTASGDYAIRKSDGTWSWI